MKHDNAAGVRVDSDARDAARYRQLRKGLPLTVVVPAPTDKKPNGKVTVIYGPNTEAAFGASLDRALDDALWRGESLEGKTG